MLINKRVINIFKNDWFLGLLLLGIFLATNGYIYGWDDQHLEIPLLKKLINPDLYAGDYYVDSLMQNFTSFLYPILSKVISIDQIPITFLILYVISRYFLFFWSYKLWHFLSKDKLTGFICVVMSIVVGRVEEFLYRTFSHQELSLAIIVAGIYLFYKNRFILSAVVFGCAANLHALYSLFPMIYMMAYLLRYHNKYGWKKFFVTGVSFVLAIIPLLVWSFKNRITPGALDKELYTDWLSLYRIACSQNFLFHEHLLKDMLAHIDTFMEATHEYWMLMVYFILNQLFNDLFRKDSKTKVVMITGTMLLLVSYVFTYMFPVKFVLDLNLIRNAQFMLFILMGYTTILIFNLCKNENLYISVPIAIAFSLIRFGGYVAVYAGLFMALWLALIAGFQKRGALKKRFEWCFPFILGGGVCIFLIIYEFINNKFSKSALFCLWVIFAFLALNTILILLARNLKNQKIIVSLKSLLLIFTLIAFIGNYMIYHRLRFVLNKTGDGFWQMQRNWIDMQNYVKENTPSNALFLVPHDMEMGGFRMFSERSVICSYRDCGIIGFDYKAGVEWKRRLTEIEPFKVFISGSIKPAIMHAVLKYKVNYIVFMNYINPGKNTLLEPVYSNEVFCLYKVIPNPVPLNN